VKLHTVSSDLSPSLSGAAVIIEGPSKLLCRVWFASLLFITNVTHSSISSRSHTLAGPGSNQKLHH